MASQTEIQVNVAIPTLIMSGHKRLATKKDPITGQTLEGTRYSVFAKRSCGCSNQHILLGYLPATAMPWAILLIGAGFEIIQEAIMLRYWTRHLTTAFTQEVIHPKVTDDQAIKTDLAMAVSVLSLELQGFKTIVQGVLWFANGYYLFNPRENEMARSNQPAKFRL